MFKSENFTQYHSTHLTTHLREAEQFDRLFMLVNNDWIDTQFVFSLSHQAVLKDFGIAFDVASTNQDYFNELPKIALLHSIVSYMSHSVPIKAIEALALMGELDQAQAWSNLLNNDDYFESQLLLAEVMCEQNNDVAAIVEVVRNLLASLAQLGSPTAENVRMLPSLDALNAVNELVSFPAPDEWEGTTQEMVDIARIPLDATIRLAQVLHTCNLLTYVNNIHHDFWQLYDQLMIRLAAEYYAVAGDDSVARDILKALKSPGELNSLYKDDPTHAAGYREAIAWAALGEFDKAKQQIDAIPNPQYLGVGYRFIALHAARLADFSRALTLVEKITDPYVLEDAIMGVVSEFSEHPDPRYAKKIIDLCERFHLDELIALVHGSLGERKQAERHLNHIDDPEMMLSWYLRVAKQAKFDRKDRAKFFKRLHASMQSLLGDDWIQLDESMVSFMIRIMLEWDMLEDLVDMVYDAPDEASFDIAINIIEALAAENMVDDISYVADIFVDDFARSELLATAILYLGLDQSGEAVHQVFRVMQTLLEDLPKEDITELDLELIAEILLDNGLIDDAEQLLNYINEQSAVRAHFAQNFARAGNFDEARRQLHGIRPIAKPVVFLSSLCTVLSRLVINIALQGKVSEARRRLSSITQFVEQVPHDNLLFHLVNCTNYALAHAAVGNIETAIHIAESVGELEPHELMGMSYRYTPDALLTILSTQIETFCEITGDGVNADFSDRARCAQLAKVRAEVLDMQNVGERAVTMTSKALMMTKATEEALQLADEMWFAQLEIVSAAIQLQDFRTAKQVLGDLTKFLDSDFQIIARTRYGSVTTAEESAAGMDEERLVRARLLMLEAELAYEEKDTGTALEKLRNAKVQLEELYRMQIPELICYLQLAGLFKRGGDTSTTDEIMEAAQNQVRNMPEQIRSDGLTEVARQYEAMNDLEKTRQLWLELLADAMMKDPDHVLGTLRYGLKYLPNTIIDLDHGSLFDNLVTIASQSEFTP